MKTKDIDIFNYVTLNSDKLPITLDRKFLEYCEINKVLAPILNLHQDLSIDDRTWNSEEKIFNTAVEEFRKLMAISNSLSIPVVLLKGLSMEKYYDVKVKRQFGDFDLLLKNKEDYYKFYEILMSLGFEYFTYPCYAKIRNEVYGVVKFIKVVNDTPVYIELNIGGFVIGEMTSFPTDKILQHTIKWNYKGIELLIPNDEMCLIIFVIETGGREYPILRDTVDFYYMYKNSTSVDLQRLHALLGDKHLSRVLNEYLQIIRDIERVSRPHHMKNKYTSSLSIEILHTLPHALKNQNRIKRLYYHYFIKLGDRLVGRGKYLKQLQKSSKYLSVSGRYNLGFFTHFVPVNRYVKGPWHLQYREGYYLLTNPTGTFVANNFCLFKVNELESVNQLVESKEYGKVK
jgi:hypothetical protein